MERFLMLTMFTFLVSAFHVSMAFERNDPYQEKVSSVSGELNQKYDIPGMAIAVIDRDRTYTYLFGEADAANNRPVTKNTIFEVVR